MYCGEFPAHSQLCPRSRAATSTVQKAQFGTKVPSAARFSWTSYRQWHVGLQMNPIGNGLPISWWYGLVTSRLLPK